MKNKGFTRQNFLKKNLNGFTLIELVITCFVISMGVIGAFTVIQRIVFYTSFSFSRSVAGYLAQEGIEIIRNIRDSNWLDPTSDWDDGINAGPSYYLDYQSQSFPDPDCSGKEYLEILSSGGKEFWQCSSNPSAKFKRKITITKPEADKIEVLVEVEWQEHGEAYKVSSQENLYNWFRLE